MPQRRPPASRGRLQPALAIALCLSGLAGGLGLAAPARTPLERQALVDLAFVLGRSHALHQLCAGPSDQYWRDRMTRLVATERPDAAFNRQLNLAFNSGFVAARGAFARCGAASRQEEARAAARGAQLSASLTGAVAEDDPPR